MERARDKLRHKTPDCYNGAGGSFCVSGRAVLSHARRPDERPPTRRLP